MTLSSLYLGFKSQVGYIIYNFYLNKATKIIYKKIIIIFSNFYDKRVRYVSFKIQICSARKRFRYLNQRGYSLTGKTAILHIVILMMELVDMNSLGLFDF